MTERPELSIVIPAYNEATRLPRTLEQIARYLEQRARSGRPLVAEIIVVDDGSTDATAAVAEAWRSRLPALRCVANPGNRGKGYSVRHGMLAARGRIALFTDADLSAPIEEADRLLAALETAQADVAIGSRALDRRLILVHQSPLRELAGRLFNWLVRELTGVPFRDTQCGFKAFRMSRARVLFERQRIEGFGFDPELLFLAQRLGLRTVEVAVRWAHDPASKVRLWGDSLRMLRDLVRIRWWWLRGAYRSSRRAP